MSKKGLLFLKKCNKGNYNRGRIMKKIPKTQIKTNVKGIER